MTLPSSGSHPIPDFSLEHLRITAVRGPMTRQVRNEVLRAGGEEAWLSLLESVSPECRAHFLGSIGLYEWVSADLSHELSQAYLARSDGEFTRRRGEDAALEQITTLNRWILRVMTPRFLVDSIPRIYGFYYRGGHAAVDRLSDSDAELSLWAVGFYPGWYQRGLTAWLETALTLTRASRVRVVYAAPTGEGLEAHRHRYMVSWQP